MYNYYPYWGQDAKGNKCKSPLFDEYSSLILGLKNREQYSIRYFYEVLESVANPETAIAVVPPHDSEKKDSGIHDLAKLMCKNNLWIDASDCLLRTVKVPKLANGGSRSIQAHLNSISVINPHIICGREVFLLDDVKTTGNSLIACRILLEKAGATLVKPSALSETYLYKSSSL